MAISHLSNAESPDAQVPLVHSTVDGVIDYKGNSALRTNSGSWRSAAFLIGKVNVHTKYIFKYL
jgi:peptide/histidine transporter 3/4